MCREGRCEHFKERVEWCRNATKGGKRRQIPAKRALAGAQRATRRCEGRPSDSVEPTSAGTGEQSLRLASIRLGPVQKETHRRSIYSDTAVAHALLQTHNQPKLVLLTSTTSVLPSGFSKHSIKHKHKRKQQHNNRRRRRHRHRHRRTAKSEGGSACSSRFCARTVGQCCNRVLVSVHGVSSQACFGVWNEDALIDVLGAVCARVRAVCV